MTATTTRRDDPKTPGGAWARMTDGNERFVDARPLHPHQDSDRRALLAGGQEPVAALFGCADSRLAAEIIFDAGLGDLFVVRNAGQVVGDTVLASLEYAVSVLHVPLIVVLGHDSCGAVATAIDTIETAAAPGSVYLDGLVEMIMPSVRRAKIELAPGHNLDAHEVGRLHIEASVRGLVEKSALISNAVADGRLAVVGANYDLANGRVEPSVVVGTL
ncbi:carbonic anhydrase [Frigoribacterium sp. 2-23]|uniref:carbonic anhydrase n=1 Tax=Frigoribacterium sp. 2-23 TaxID=3415006 RepID=UPI003C701ED7